MGVSRITEVVPNLYQLPMNGSSAFLLAEAEVTLIDAGWRGYSHRVFNFLSELGRSPKEVSYIISTHYHLDHIGGVARLKERTSGRVAVHETEVPFVERQRGEKLPNPFQNRALGLLMSPLLSLYRPPPFGVDLPLSDGARLPQLGGLEVVHSPGHTPGSISLYSPREGLLIVGDALQYKRGKLGLPSRLFSTDLGQARESVRRLARLEFDILCFSHFPAIRRGASRALRDFADTLD